MLEAGILISSCPRNLFVMVAGLCWKVPISLWNRSLFIEPKHCDCHRDCKVLANYNESSIVAFLSDTRSDTRNRLGVASGCSHEACPHGHTCPVAWGHFGLLQSREGLDQNGHIFWVVLSSWRGPWMLPAMETAIHRLDHHFYPWRYLGVVWDASSLPDGLFLVYHENSPSLSAWP